MSPLIGDVRGGGGGGGAGAVERRRQMRNGRLLISGGVERLGLIVEELEDGRARVDAADWIR